MTPRQLKMLRKRLKLSQRKLGDRLGLHSNTVARMERGETAITRATAKHAELLEEHEKLKASVGNSKKKG